MIHALKGKGWMGRQPWMEPEEPEEPHEMEVVAAPEELDGQR